MALSCCFSTTMVGVITRIWALIVVMSTIKIGAKTNDTCHGKSVEGSACFGGSRSAAGSGFCQSQREYNPQHGSTGRPAYNKQRSDCPQCADHLGGPRNR